MNRHGLRNTPRIEDGDLDSIGDSLIIYALTFESMGSSLTVGSTPVHPYSVRLHRVMAEKPAPRHDVTSLNNLNDPSTYEGGVQDPLSTRR